MLAHYADPLAPPVEAAKIETVMLSAEEIALAAFIAYRRNRNGKAMTDWAQGYADGLTLHTQGIQAEIAVRRYFSLPIDDAFVAWGIAKESVRSPDLVVNGWQIEVKAATSFPPVLRFYRKQVFDKDFVILCHWRSFGAVDIYAAMSRRRYMAKRSLKQVLEGREPCYCVDLADMTPVGEFGAWVRTHKPDPRNRNKAIMIAQEGTPCQSNPPPAPADSALPTSSKTEASSEVSASLPNTSTDSPSADTSPPSS